MRNSEYNQKWGMKNTIIQVYMRIKLTVNPFFLNLCRYQNERTNHRKSNEVSIFNKTLW